MSYSIIRIERVKNANATTGMQKHNQRENTNYSNTDIQKDLTHKNYDLIHGSRKIDYNTAIENRIENGYTGKRKIRKDAIKHVQGIVTSDKAFFDNQSEQSTQNFFEGSLKFIEQKYGKDNVLYATVHLDEQTPHMHFGFVPLTEQGKLSAKEVVGNKRELTALQDEYNQFVNQNGYNLQRGTSSEQSNARHQSVAEYKKDTDYHNELQQENERLESQIETRHQELNHLDTQKTTQQQELEQVQTHLKHLKAQIQQQEEEAKLRNIRVQGYMPPKHEIEYEKNMFGKSTDQATGRVIVDKDVFENQVELHQDYRAVVRENNMYRSKDFVKENNELQQRLKTITTQNKQLAEENEGLSTENRSKEQKISDLRSENVRLGIENEDLTEKNKKVIYTLSYVYRTVKRHFGHHIDDFCDKHIGPRNPELLENVRQHANMIEKRRQNELEM